MSADRVPLEPGLDMSRDHPDPFVRRGIPASVDASRRRRGRTAAGQPTNLSSRDRRGRPLPSCYGLMISLSSD